MTQDAEQMMRIQYDVLCELRKSDLQSVPELTLQLMQYTVRDIQETVDGLVEAGALRKIDGKVPFYHIQMSGGFIMHRLERLLEKRDGE